MLIIKDLEEKPVYYHQYALYHGDPQDDTTWEPGESYRYDDYKEKYVREMVPLPYEPLCFITDEEWLKNRILAYADENPLMCDIQNRGNIEGTRSPYSNIMVASIPKGMAWLLMEDT